MDKDDKKAIAIFIASLIGKAFDLACLFLIIHYAVKTALAH